MKIIAGAIKFVFLAVFIAVSSVFLFLGGDRGDHNSLLDKRRDASWAVFRGTVGLGGGWVMWFATGEPFWLLVLIFLPVSLYLVISGISDLVVLHTKDHAMLRREEAQLTRDREASVEVPSLGIGRYDGLFLLATPSGFFVVTTDELKVVSSASFTQKEKEDYGPVGAERIVGYGKAQDMRNRRRWQELDEKLCRSFSIRHEEASRRFYLEGDGPPLRDHWTFFTSDIRRGRRIVFGAIDWSWSKFGTVTIEHVEGLTAGTLIKIVGRDGLVFLPSEGLERIAVWPTRAVFGYAGRSVMLNLREPEWETIENPPISKPPVPDRNDLNVAGAEQASKDFEACWLAARNHIASQVQGPLKSWLKANPDPPFQEHLSFRLGNQLFFVRIEDIDGVLSVPGTREGLLAIAQGCRGHPCIMSVRKSREGWTPEVTNWGLVDLGTGRPLNPVELVTNELIEMTDWELQDFAVQTVRRKLEKNGRRLMSSQGNPEIDPSIWFVGEDGPEWVVVRVSRYGASEAAMPANWQQIATRCAPLSAVGHFASVTVANGNGRFVTGLRPQPLWRGHELVVRFTDLIPWPA